MYFQNILILFLCLDFLATYDNVIHLVETGTYNCFMCLWLKSSLPILISQVGWEIQLDKP